MKELLIPILLAVALIPTCSGQTDEQELRSLYNELTEMTDSIELEVQESGLTFPDIMNQIKSIRRNLFLADTLINQGFYSDARSTLVQVTASISLLRQDVDELGKSVVKTNDPIFLGMIIIVLIIIAALFVILEKVRKKSYKPADT
jgi:hypothetical protein